MSIVVLLALACICFCVSYWAFRKLEVGNSNGTYETIYVWSAMFALIFFLSGGAVLLTWMLPKG